MFLTLEVTLAAFFASQVTVFYASQGTLVVFLTLEESLRLAVFLTLVEFLPLEVFLLSEVQHALTLFEAHCIRLSLFE